MVNLEGLNILSLLVTASFLWRTLIAVGTISLLALVFIWRHRLKIYNQQPITHLEILSLALLIILILTNSLILFKYAQLL